MGIHLTHKHPSTVTSSLRRGRTRSRIPVCTLVILAFIILFCTVAPYFMNAAGRMDFSALNQAPSQQHLLGTDSLGRDLLSMIADGGRSSLLIGLLATVISTLIAIVYGTVSGLAATWLDSLLMRVSELLLSIPSILYVTALQAAFGKASLWSLSVVIGISSWMSIAKMVRSEVKQLRKNEYVEFARMMGAKLPYLVQKHLFGNFLPAILFMVISNITQAIAAEAALSFLGIGLPPSVISWGTLMALAETALFSGSWWIVLFPGTVLTITLICITELGESLRFHTARKAE